MDQNSKMPRICYYKTICVLKNQYEVDFLNRALDDTLPSLSRQYSTRVDNRENATSPVSVCFKCESVWCLGARQHRCSFSAEHCLPRLCPIKGAVDLICA